MPDTTDPTSDQAAYDQAIKERDDDQKQLDNPNNDPAQYNDQIAGKKQEADRLAADDPKKAALDSDASNLEQKQDQSKQQAAQLQAEKAQAQAKADAEKAKAPDVDSAKTNRRGETDRTRSEKLDPASEQQNKKEGFDNQLSEKDKASIAGIRQDGEKSGITGGTEATSEDASSSNVQKKPSDDTDRPSRGRSMSR